MDRPKYFKTPAEFRRWLARHHDAATELVVGYHKVKTGKPSMTWSDSVDEALCYGWIDGVRRRVDDERYCIRFTPRRPDSTWSKVNLEKVARLKEEGRMQPAGLAAFSKRTPERMRTYAYEKAPPRLAATYTRELKGDPAVWEFFSAQPPSYRRKVVHWIMNAKQEATRRRRLGKLIEHCRAESRVP